MWGWRPGTCMRGRQLGALEVCHRACPRLRGSWASTEGFGVLAFELDMKCDVRKYKGCINLPWCVDWLLRSWWLRDLWHLRAGKDGPAGLRAPMPPPRRDPQGCRLRWPVFQL